MESLATEQHWYDEYDNIVELTGYLAKTGWPADQVAYAIEKPHKFEEQFRESIAARAVDELQCQKPVGISGMCIRMAGHDGRCSSSSVTP